MKFSYFTSARIATARLTSASEAFDTHPVLNILEGTTFTVADAVHKSRIFTILSNFIFTFGPSGAKLSLGTATSDGVELLRILLSLWKRTGGCEINPFAIDNTLATHLWRTRRNSEVS